MNEMRRLPIKNEVESQERADCRFRMIVLAAVIVGMFAIAIGANLWLDSGCSVSGVITEHGKECIN